MGLQLIVFYSTSKTLSGDIQEDSWMDVSRAKKLSLGWTFPFMNDLCMGDDVNHAKRWDCLGREHIMRILPNELELAKTAGRKGKLATHRKD